MTGPFAICALHPTADGKVTSQRYPSEQAAETTARQLARDRGRPFVVLGPVRTIYPPDDTPGLFDQS